MRPAPDIASDTTSLPRAVSVLSVAPAAPIADRRARLATLRAQLARLEPQERHGAAGCLSLGAPEIHAHLPTPGLAGGVLHEVAGATHADRPAAFGFVAALMAVAVAGAIAAPAPPPRRTGPAFLVATRRALGHFGRPCGRGLGQAGLDPSLLILVEARSDKDALWALEEVLVSEARPAVVAGAIEAPLGLTGSRRLNLAAARSGTPLLVLGAPGRTGAGSSAAATRWRIAAAPAGRDRFGALAQPRWRIALERCRHGRPGEWLIEWDHATHRFRLAQGVADRAPAAGAGLRRRTA